MDCARSTELWNRVHGRIGVWRIDVERFAETESSILVFGQRDDQPVVLKVIKRPGDEWRAGGILDAFEGRGVVRVYEYVDGAMLLERLSPGRSLVTTAFCGTDDDATAVLAETIRMMSPRCSRPAPFSRFSQRRISSLPMNTGERRIRACGPSWSPHSLPYSLPLWPSGRVA